VRCRGVNQHTGRVPNSTFDAAGFIDHAQFIELIVANVNKKFGQQCHIFVIFGPLHIFDWMASKGIELVYYLSERITN
jgi:hypothetical protein